MKKSLIVKVEMIPYLSLFDLNRAWLDLKEKRMAIAEEFRELQSKAWKVTHSITEIEEKLSEAIKKLERKNV